MENEYDDIDKIFQETFGNEDGESMAWNDPGDDLFRAAMDKVDRDKKRRIGIFPWWTLGAGIFVLALFIGTSRWLAPKGASSSILPMNNHSVLGTAPTTSTQKATSIKHNESTSSDKATSNITDLELTPSSSKKNTVTTFKKLKNDADRRLEKSPEGLIKKSRFASELSEPVSQNNFISQTARNDKETITLGSKRKNISELPQLTFSLKKLNTPFIEIEKPNSFGAENKDGKKVTPETGWRIFAAPIAHVTSLGMKNITLSGGTITKYDRSYWGHGFQLGLEKEITSNFIAQIKTGFQYLQNRSLYKKETTFDENLVDNMGGLQQNYLTNITIADPTGSFNESFDAVIQKDIMEDKDIMKQKSHILSEFYMVHSNITVAYQYDINNTFSVITGIGLDMNYILTANRTVSTDLYKKTEIVMADKIKTKSPINLNKINVGLATTLGLRYQFNSHWDISLQASYHHGLNPINKSNSSSIGKTYIKDWNSGVQIGYRF